MDYNFDMFIAGFITGLGLSILFWHCVCPWLWQHRPVSRKRAKDAINAAYKDGCAMAEALAMKDGNRVQPRDPATGKFCKRGG